MSEGLRLDDDDLETLRACCSKRPPRNAGAIVAAIKLRLEFSQPKPQQKIEHSGSIEVTKIERVVVDPQRGPDDASR